MAVKGIIGLAGLAGSSMRKAVKNLGEGKGRIGRGIAGVDGGLVQVFQVRTIGGGEGAADVRMSFIY